MKQWIAVFIATTALAGCVMTGQATSGQASFAPAGASYTLGPAEVSIRAVLSAQAASWNRGDLDGFLSGYWRSDDLRFASGGNVARGYDQLVERYRTTYPDRAAMGELSFSDLEIDQISPDAAVVHGAWSLTLEADKPSGLFTLVFRQIGGEWLIVSDTTTSAR